MASMFSIEQMMTTLSFLSRITSISYSFQPMTDCSMSTSVTGEASRPRWTMRLELLDVVGDAAARAAEREGGADDQRQADVVEHLAGVVHVVDDAAARDLQADLDHQVFEDLAVLAAMDRVAVGADHLHAVLREDALVEAGHAGVQARLPAERRAAARRSACRCAFSRSRIFSTASGVIGSM